jgi:F-type H+-transporting ATPase subunit b
VLEFSVTFLITIVNIAFLYFALRKVLFKPVTDFMENRTNKIQRDIDGAKISAARAQALEAEFTERLKNAQEEGKKIIQSSRDKAEQEYASIVAKAKEEAARILAATELEIEQERRLAELALRRETAELSIGAASRILSENIDSERNRKLVEKFLETAGVA